MILDLYSLSIVASLLIVAAILVLWWLLKRRSELAVKRGYRETDLRLTYKRFLEIYPSSEINYEAYKQLQAKKAYKKAVSSKKIKRMVR
ncbi:MAG: hypothetical protein OEX76_02770 [Candidatus Bathyarchaeota archaeon]|nr:hypothetical protein [Candidatus Bathyarchaeota archaeon]MDH5713457.1 hypothetical protein [Candidatus Bathyarchaeota archaeon]